LCHFSVGERPGAGLTDFSGGGGTGLPFHIGGTTRLGLGGGGVHLMGLGGGGCFGAGFFAAIVLPPLLYFTLGISDQSSSILKPSCIT